MTPGEPLRTARTLVRLGLYEEALTTLEQAISNDPGREDVRTALAELRRARSPAGRARLALDLVMVWLLLLATGAAVMGLGTWGVKVMAERTVPFVPAWAELPLLAVVVAACIGLVPVWLHLFLHTWFCYLKYVSRANRTHVERRLPDYFKVGMLEPQYSSIRRRYFKHA